MNKLQKIGIIGATGNIGTQLMFGLSKAGYELEIFARNKEKLADKRNEALQSNTGAKIDMVSETKQLVTNSDVVFLALPHGEVAKITEEIKESAAGKIIVSVANPLNETYSGLVTGWETSDGEETQKALPDAKVVKAINTIFAGRINNPIQNGVKITHFIAGDDSKAVEVVSEIAKNLGHNPVHIGGIVESRTLEHMAFVNISLSLKKVFNWDSAYVLGGV